MRIVSILIFAVLCSFASADVVVLKDGTRVDGDLKRGDGGYDVTDANGKVTHVASNDIQSIQLGKSTSGGSALDKLGSLKRSVDALDDLNKIIGRYNEFIQQNKDTPASADAQKELAIWQDRFDKHMVKVGGKWVTPEQQDQMLAQCADIIKQAYDLMKANKLKEAEPVVKQALDVDPTNPMANYLEGILLFRSDKIVPARKCFDIVHAQLPSDAATLNNLGVCAWRQNQFIISLGFYCDAMLALPANKEIISNVAEVLAVLKDDFKKNPTAQRASRLFVEQNAKLEATMAQYGWYRWGSMWVDQNQLDDLKKAEKQVQDQIDKVQKDFDVAKKKISDNEAQIQKDHELITDIDLSMSQYNNGGFGLGTGSNAVTGTNIVTGPTGYGPTYPRAYTDAVNDVNRLTGDNTTLAHNLDQYRAEARRLDATKPKPTYTGVQNLIGVEGMPKIGGIVADSGPTSQPAVAPAMATPAKADRAPATQPAAPTTAHGVF